MAKPPKNRDTAYEKPTPEKIAVGKRMEQARVGAGLTMTEAASRLGYSQPVQLSLIESGKRMPPSDVVRAAAKLYGYTADFLLCLSDDPDRDPVAGIQRLVAARITADLQTLGHRIAECTSEIARRALPSVAEGVRLAEATLETQTRLRRFMELNPEFADTMRGGAPLLSAVTSTAEAAGRYLAEVERARRLMTVKAEISLDRAKLPPGQMAFDMLSVFGREGTPA